MASSKDPCVTVLPVEQVIGLSFTALAGFISSFAVMFVLVLVARNYMRNARNPPPGGEWKLIRTHVDAYLLSLLTSDFLQGVGAILNIKWAAEKRVYCSNTCTAQGSIKVMGETGVAMATFAIALHTFLVIFFRWSPSPRSSWIWKAGISFIWLYVIVYAVAGYLAHRRPSDDGTIADPFYTPVPYWCWISHSFLAERITAEYLWFWFAAFSSIVLYTFLFFRIRGNITVDPLDWRRVRFKWRRRHSGDDGDGYFDGAGRGARGGEAGKAAAKEAMSMIWYPVTYTVLVLPLSLVRWVTFRPTGEQEPTVPFAVASVAITLFGLSGIVNVILILLTRKNLLLFGQRGVVNPTKIGPAATGRLPPQQRRHSGGSDASFPVGRFTTKAFATKRSFDLDSNRAPFSPVTGAADTNQMGATESMLSGIMIDEEQSYGLGYDSGGDLTPADSGIPEGMSRYLGIRGEYNVDIDREKEGKSFGLVQQPATIDADAMLTPGTGRGGQTGSTGVETQLDVSQHSNFLEMKSSRSNPGQPEADHPQYAPQPIHRPPPHALPPRHHAPPSPHQSYPYSQSHPHSHTQAQPHPQRPYAEGRRGSAGTGARVGGGSRPGSAKSKAGSSIHPGRPSGDLADYSVPMKFNPTPAPTSTVPSGLTTTHLHPHHNRRRHSYGASSGSDTPDSSSPFAGKSCNRSSKSLGKVASTASLATTTATTAKSPRSGITSMFSKRDSYGTSPPDSAQSDTSMLPPPKQPLSQQPPALLRQHLPGSVQARHSPHQIPNQPYQQAGQQDVAQTRPLHFSHDFGPKLHSSFSPREAELERSPFHDAARLERAPPHEALALSRPTTGNSSHDGAIGAGIAGDLGGSWSRVSLSGRRGTQGTQSDEDAHHLRPSTAGSNRSYTFGPPGFKTGAAAAGTEHDVEMQERPRHVSMRPPHSPLDAQNIGRAL